MALTPDKHDVAAGFTETLIAVAVRRYEGWPDHKLPWVDIGSAGIGWNWSFDKWLKELPDWDEDLHYILLVVPEADYQPLSNFKIQGYKELDTLPFLATKEDVAKVIAARAQWGSQA
jgi:hypothetical protein